MVKPFVLILIGLVVLVHAQDQSGFISIDCGLTDNSTYIDGKTGIYYVSDGEYLNTENGVSETISPQYQTNDLDQQFVHVRSFPQGTKNCYTLKPPRFQNRNRYFIRARFFYGNYDNKNQFPKFDLYFGVDYWVTIQFADGITPINKEILHVPSNSSAYTYVCLVNTDQGTPFISALEVRLVDDGIYRVDSGSLQLFNRYDLKAYSNRKIIRYKDDIFDRLWKPSFFQFGVTELTTTTNTTDIVQNVYKVPHIIMQTAITPQNASEPIEFYFLPPDPTAGYYLYMHFADFQASLTRNFNITLNNAPWYSNFSPNYLSITTVYSPTPQTPASRVNISLIKTANSSLPPIFNALEIYTARKFSFQLTSQEDVNAITSIKATYGLKKDWQGDPCLPANFSWESIGCYNTTPIHDPRIISLNLSSNGLTVKISLFISNLKMLQKLDLSNNSLVGSVPDFLSELQHLQVLVLSGNNLSGIIPEKLLEKSNSKLLKLSVEGNPNLCMSGQCVISPNSTTPPPPPATTNRKKSTKMMFYIIAFVVGGVILIVAVVVMVWILIRIKRRKSQKQHVANEPPTEVVLSTINKDVSNSREAPFQMNQKQFTYSDVVRITANFQRELGKGGFGAVYHGYLDNIQVAVKMLSSTSNQGYNQFRAEAELLTRVHHKNLTTLVGYCDEGDKQGLIYEYMAKSDLRSHLSERNLNVLSWAKRLNIVVDVAQGVEYLHTGCKPPIIHRDIKSTNILLNNEFQGKLADFGLSKVFPKEDETHMSTGFAGTPGYLDPEYNINEKSDVFSFGIVLLEIVTGRPPISKFPERIHLYKWVDHMIKTNGDTRNVVDPRLGNEFDINSMWKTVDLAMECVSNNSNTRPNMSQVVIELKMCLGMEKSRLKSGNESSTYDSIEVSSLNINATGMNPSAR